MSLTVWTAQLRYLGPDRLDITRAKGSAGMGLAFAPSWRLLGPQLKVRRTIESAEERGERLPEDVTVALEHFMWAAYKPAFLAEMRLSYRDQRDSWNELLDLGEVTLVCFCRNPRRCHRTLVAELLCKLGATYQGERDHG